MNIKDYIQSGIIEQYVLGLANAEEAAELELLRKQYPELNDAILEFELLYESHLMADQLQPPVHIKSNLEKELFGAQTPGTIVKPLQPPSPRQPATWKYLAAASIILLLISTALNFYFYSGYSKTKDQYQALLVQNNTLQANNASYKESLDLFQDTTMLRIELKALPNKANNLAIVLWNKQSKEVYIDVDAMQQTPQGKQYQLWAIVNNKPVSIGVIDNCTGLCKMEKIEGAQAFAITLEKQGGSLAPTLDEMYVMGKI